MLQGTLWNPADILTAIQDRRSKVDGDFAHLARLAGLGG